MPSIRIHCVGIGIRKKADESSPRGETPPAENLSACHSKV